MRGTRGRCDAVFCMEAGLPSIYNVDACPAWECWATRAWHIDAGLL